MADVSCDVFRSVFDSWIIRRMMRESMVSRNAELLQCTVALVNQTALRALCFFSNKLAHKMQARPWSLVSILALLHSMHACICMHNKLVVLVSNFYVQSWQLRSYDHAHCRVVLNSGVFSLDG